MPEPNNLFSAQIADALGFAANTSSYFTADLDITIGELLTVMGVWLGRVQDCSDGRIVEAQIRLGVDVSAFAEKAIPEGTATSTGMVLHFTNTEDALPWDFLVPAVAADLVVGGGPDMSEDATIDRLADMMENLDPTLAGLTFASDRGGALAGPASGFFSARKRGRVSNRKTIRVGT